MEKAFQLAVVGVGLLGALWGSTAQAAESTKTGFGAYETHKELWVNIGGFSRHFTRDRRYNESNYGLGVEYRINPDVSVMAGSYYNSIRRTTTYATTNWQPLRLGDFKIGGAVGVMDGYPAIARGGSFFVALPMASYEGKRFGVNLGVIPSTGKVDGALILQLKVRAF